MENNDKQIVERLETATSMLERTLRWLEERQDAGEVARISATVEQDRRGVNCRRSWRRLNANC